MQHNTLAAPPLHHGVGARQIRQPLVRAHAEIVVTKSAGEANVLPAPLEKVRPKHPSGGVAEGKRPWANLLCCNIKHLQVRLAPEKCSKYTVRFVPLNNTSTNGRSMDVPTTLKNSPSSSSRNNSIRPFLILLPGIQDDNCAVRPTTFSGRERIPPPQPPMRPQEAKAWESCAAAQSRTAKLRDRRAPAEACPSEPLP